MTTVLADGWTGVGEKLKEEEKQSNAIRTDNSVPTFCKLSLSLCEGDANTKEEIYKKGLERMKL